MMKVAIAVATLVLACAGSVQAGSRRASTPPTRASTTLSQIAATLALPQAACRRAIAAAEVSHGIPTGFLLAIGRVESGRLDAQSGSVQPWPWTIDINMKGTFFESRVDAVTFVEAAQQAGIQSIDVGCMQVNLLQHPDAFHTVDDAFDPVVNANYAARFLVELEHECGDWVTAAGLYHSRTEALAAPYRDAVALQFGGAAGLPGRKLVVAPAPASPERQLAQAWSATLTKVDTGGLHLWPKLASPRRGSAVASVQLSSR